MPDEQKMKVYIGTEIINAGPKTKHEFAKDRGREIACNDIDEPGYIVVSPDGYVSWSPKEVFDIAYREISPEEIRLTQ